jgi:DNA-binding CsgD family transcriptional regulator
MMPVSMVGRKGELDELTRAWARVTARSAARTHTVVITGGAGLGKSMLATAAVESFLPEPTIVLSGTARVHAPAPYDWLAAVLDGRETGGISVPPDALAWLAQHPDAQRERYAPSALLRMAVRTVRELVGPGPAVVLVEDLHALDPASLNLVAELCAAPELPVLLLVTSQPPDAAVSPQLAARTLARLSGSPAAVRQHLGPLRPVEVGQILAQVYPDVPVPDGVAQALWRRTKGNPYWLRELLATAGAVGPAALSRKPLPGHLRLASPAAEGPGDGARDGSTLTAREREVLAYLAQGMSNKGIARSLGISIRTVTVHVSNLLRKTRLSSRTEAALWAVQQSAPPTATVPDNADSDGGALDEVVLETLPLEGVP